MGKAGVYAVAHGRKTGIFTTWAQAEAQVKGFPGAKYKKFFDPQEAAAFVHQFHKNSVVQAARIPPPPPPHPPTLGSTRSHKRPLPFYNEDDYEADSERQPPAKKKPPQEREWVYVVTCGRQTGIFDDWHDVMHQIEGFVDAHFRKFDSEPQAREYLRQLRSQEQLDLKQLPPEAAAPAAVPAPAAAPSDALSAPVSTCEAARPRRAEPDPLDPNTLVAFCDGSALHNGATNVRAGYACVFPHHPHWDVAKPLESTPLHRATNNRAEYSAALEALQRANEEDPSGQQPLFIFTDSQLLIKSMTQWISSWQRNGWVKANGGEVQNRDLLEKLVDVKADRKILWRHVKAHTGRKDWYSKWNDVADRRARQAALP